MSARTTCLVSLGLLLASRPAFPCGGGFGQGIEIDPAQTILLAHRDGVETYVFRPHFCGEATDFGLILPVPAALSASPELAESTLFDEVDAVTAPNVITECQSSGGGCGADLKGGVGGARNFDPGVNVINAGQVGIFDWALLQADTSAAFTDWLDTNGFPYDATSAAHFSFYVSRQWFFVAFKVTAGSEAPPSGSKLCGDLGPLVLRFPAAAPVVPARIAAVNRSNQGANTWRVFIIAPTQLGLSTGEYWSDLYFSGPLSASELEARPALSRLASVGDRLTGLTVYFPWEAPGDDIHLEPVDAQDFRSTIYRYEECGCAGANAGILQALVLALLGRLLWGGKRTRTPLRVSTQH